MELSAASANGKISRASLLVLPADCLLHVLSFDVLNGVAMLILTGSKPIIYKLSRTSHLSVVWTNMGDFIYWNKASHLVKSLPRLESLELAAMTQSILTQGPVNPGIFLPSLRSLKLCYHGSAELLTSFHVVDLFEPLVSLETFELRDSSLSYSSIVSLSHFPRTLKSLRIQSAQANQVNLAADLTELRNLPSTLEAVHLDINNVGSSSLYAGLVHTWPAHLASVTHLTLRVSTNQSLDISAIAPRLKRLRVSGKLVCYGKDVDLDTPLTPTFPVLQSLAVHTLTLSNWNQFRNLPPSLTELTMAFSDSLLLDTGAHDALDKLNRECEDAHGVPQYAAPKRFCLIERVSHYNFDFSIAVAAHLLPHFPSLRGALYGIHVFPNEGAPPQINLPRSLTNVSFATVPIASLPTLPRVHTLGIEALQGSLSDLERLHAMNPAGVLAGTTTLRFPEMTFPVELVALLPQSIETLSFSPGGASVMKALVQKSDAGLLPNLSTIHVARSCELSTLDTTLIPATVTELSGVSFSATDPNGSIARPSEHPRHPRLLRLSIHKADLIRTLPHLPTGLHKFEIALTAPVNLANPDEALALYHMRQQLPHLRTLVISMYDQSTFPHWLIPVSRNNPPQLSLSRWLSLPMALKTLYARYWLIGPQAGLIWSEKSVRHSSELFALSCLPRGLSFLQLPSHAVADRTSRMTPLKLNWSRVLRATLKFQFPLLGLPILHLGPSHPHERVVSALPPRLSVPYVTNSSEELTGLISHRATGFFRGAYTSPLPERAWLWSLEPAFHVTNALSWLLIGLFGPSSWKTNSLLQGLIWSNVFGSSLTAPILIRRLFKSGVILPQLRKRVARSSGVALGITFLLNMALHLGLSFGIGSSSYPSFFRAFAVSLSLTVSLGRNHIILAVNR